MNGRTSSVRSGWLAISITTDMSNSPRRLRHSKVEQAVVVNRRHDGDAFRLGGLREAKIDAERRGEVALQHVAGGDQAGHMKDGALHEHSAGLLRGMLI